MFEDLGRRFGGCVAGLIAKFGDTFVNTVQGRARAGEAVQREVKGFAIMSTDHELSDFAAVVALIREVTQGKKVSETFAHLFALDQKMRAVQPVFHKRPAIFLYCCAFALGDLILVMGKG